MNSMNEQNSSGEQWFPRLPEGYEYTYGEEENWNASTAQRNAPSMTWDSWGRPMQPGYSQGNQWQQGNQWGQHGHWNPSQQHGWPGTPQQDWQQHGWPWQGGFPGQSAQPPSFPGQGGGSGSPQGAPTSPPPSRTPSYPDQQMLRVDPGGIQGCLFRNTYIWTSRRSGFWFFPTFVGRTSVAGFRWNNQWRRWEYTGIDLNRVDAFTCV